MATWKDSILTDDDHNQESSIGSWSPDVSPLVVGTCTIDRINRPLAGTTSDWEIQIDPDYANPIETVMISNGSDNDMNQNYFVETNRLYLFSVTCGNLDETDGEAHFAVSWYYENGDKHSTIHSENRVPLGAYPDTVLVSEVVGAGPAGNIKYMRMHLVVEPADPYEALVFARDFYLQPQSRLVRKEKTKGKDKDRTSVQKDPDRTSVSYQDARTSKSKMGPLSSTVEGTK